MKIIITAIAIILISSISRADYVTSCSYHTYANGKTKYECVTREIKPRKVIRNNNLYGVRYPYQPPARPFYSLRRPRK